MIDQTVLAYCNLFGVLGAIPELLRIDEGARALVEGKRISIGFSVKNGPKGKLSFSEGAARLEQGCRGCSVKLYFPSCRAFNNMIDGKGSPIPIKGFFKLGFLLGNFTKLTDILSSYLRPAEGVELRGEELVKATRLTLHVIAGAVAQVANEDPVGRFSASNIVDGCIKLTVGDPQTDGTAIAVIAEDHRLRVPDELPESSMSEMQFADYETANALFGGRINAVAAVGTGRVRVFGMISQVDNVNRILDRVSMYLA